MRTRDNAHSFFFGASDLSEPLLDRQEPQMGDAQDADAKSVSTAFITGEKRARYILWLRMPSKSRLLPTDVKRPEPAKYKPLPAEADSKSKEYNGEAPEQIKLNAVAAAMGAFSFK